MKLPLSSFKSYIDTTDIGEESLAETLTMAGLEVDAIAPIKFNFKKVCTAKVLACSRHPDAEKLQVAQVNDGKETYQVVCGAPNCREGIIVALAQVGATLLMNDEKPLKIKKGKIRGVESHGMLCAKEELGLEEKSELILELPENTPLGEPVENLFADKILEISLTPNLGHCASLVGVSRELSALFDRPYSLPKIQLPTASKRSIHDAINVKVNNSYLCPRYACRVIEGITLGPSPEWLKSFLEKCGLRSINNIVDITNFVLLEMGQPMHAFDLDLIEGKSIIVRESKKGEKIPTLDGQTHELDEGHLLICDKEKPIAIAGVMGGSNSEISEKSRSVLLEAAYFQPATVRKTSKATSLQTDSSWRFERGTDPNMVLKALDRAASLVLELAGGELLEGVIDEKNHDFSPKVLSCSLKEINALLGTKLSENEIQAIFTRLEFDASTEEGSLFHVKVPFYRHDISIKVDLIEEIARVYGYQNIPRQTPKFFASTVENNPSYTFEQKLHRFFLSQGLQEFLTNVLVSENEVKTIFGDFFEDSLLVRLKNPASVDHALMRPSLLPGLLNALKHNQAHYRHQVQAYEIGKVHFKENASFSEKHVAALVLSGPAMPRSWEKAHVPLDFFDLKGIFENLIDYFKLKQASFVPSHLNSLHPHRQAQLFVSGKEVGSLGELHPNLLKAWDIDHRVYFAEICLETLRPLCCDEKEVQCQSLPQYPGSERDWTLTLKEEASYLEVIELFEQDKPKHLQAIHLKDIYRGKPIAENSKSLTFNFLYRSDKKTLASETIEKEHEKFKEKVSEKLSHLLG